MWIVAKLLVIALVSAAVARPASAESDKLVEELLGGGPVLVRDEAAWKAAFAGLLDSLVPEIAADEVTSRERSQQVIERICLRAGQPGAELQRRGLCLAMVARLSPATPKLARVWLLRKLETIGREEAVAPLVELLSDADAEIRDPARRALENNPTQAALRALRERLAESADAPVPARIALIQSLAARRDEGSAPALVELRKSPDESVATAALQALGGLASMQALDELERAARSAEGLQRDIAALAAVRCAHDLIAAGRGALVEPQLVRIAALDCGASAQRAALSALALARGADAAPLLLELLRGENRDHRRAAAQLVPALSAAEIGPALCTALPGLPAQSQALLLHALGARGEAGARSVALAALGTDDPQVRVAAARTLRDVGDWSCVLPLAQMAAAASPAERQAARDTLARLHGAVFDEQVLRLVADAPPAPRAELIRTLAARRYKPAVADLLREAASGAEEVRVAALNALALLAEPAQIAAVLPLALGGDSEALSKAGEDAVVAISLREPDLELRSAPLIGQLHAATPVGALALVRMLGRLEGPAALQVMRAARQGEDAALADAAIRALAGWSTIEVLDDLSDVLAQSTDAATSAIALRGYVRLVRLPTERSAADTLALLQRVEPVCTGPDSRKLLLSALAETPHAGALALIEGWVGDPALREEAALAALRVARGIAADNGQVAREALARLAGLELAEATRQKVNETAAWLEQMGGYCARWLVSPVYTEEGRDRAVLLDVAFAPERDEAVEWTPLSPGGAANPWIFDLTKLDGGQNCCVYVKTSVWSDAAQAVRIELGSDDGAKLWLAGEPLFESNTIRPVQPAQDKIDATLSAGWNVILLKVTQGSGSWGFCLGVKAPDGGNLAGLRFEAR